MKTSLSKVYSRYVSLMKTILPLSILLSIGLALGWPYFSSMGKEEVPQIDASHPEIKENRMIRPHYISTDKKGQPFHLTAHWAKQKTENLSDLINPEGSMTMIEGETFNIKSQKGYYDTQEKILTLEDKVTLTSTDGYHITTEKAQVSIDKKIIEGDNFIKGQGPTGEIMGTKGFKVETQENGKKKITLKGRSSVKINRSPRKKG